VLGNSPSVCTSMLVGLDAEHDIPVGKDGRDRVNWEDKESLAMCQ